MIRVLHVITTIERGGAENHLIDLIGSQLASGNYSIEIAYLKGNPYWRNELQKMGLTVHDLKMKYYGDFRPILKLKRIISNHKPDLVHAHLAPAELYIGLINLRKASYKFIVSRHNEYTFRKTIVEKILAYILGRSIDGCICISNAVLSAYEANPSYKNVIFSTIHYGRTHTALPEKKQIEITKPSDEKIILVNSRLIPQKKIDTAIRAFDRFLRSGSYETWKLKIIGVGPLEATLRDLVSSLDLNGRVLFTGFVENIDELNFRSEIFLHTPSEEGFGLVLLEAMNASLPIISTNVSAIPEIVEHLVTGHLHTVGDEIGISESLQLFANSEDIRSDLGRRGREKLIEYFNLSRQHDETSSAYKTVLEL